MLSMYVGQVWRNEEEAVLILAINTRTEMFYFKNSYLHKDRFFKMYPIYCKGGFK